MAICFENGTEIAYRLFSQTKTIGSRWTPAKFIDSCQSPLLVAPSPNHTAATDDSLRSFIAYATPTACGIWVAIGEDCEIIPSRREPQGDGICRPPDDGSVAFASTPRKMS